MRQPGSVALSQRGRKTLSAPPPPAVQGRDFRTLCAVGTRTHPPRQSVELVGAFLPFYETSGYPFWGVCVGNRAGNISPRWVPEVSPKYTEEMASRGREFESIFETTFFIGHVKEMAFSTNFPGWMNTLISNPSAYRGTSVATTKVQRSSDNHGENL